MTPKTKQPPKHYYTQESDRLIFRAIASSDIDLWEPFFENNPTIRFVGADQFPHLSNKEKSTNWLSRQIERQSNQTYGQLAVIEKATRTFIGVGGIIERNDEALVGFEITYSLLPPFWGKGYATELAMHFKSFALENIASREIASIIHLENEASINVAKKNGMHETRTVDNYMGMPVAVYKLHQ